LKWLGRRKGDITVEEKGTVDEPKVLLIALRQITEARGGFAKVAKAAGARRESLYRALSPRQPAPLHASGRHPRHRITPHRESREAG